MSATIATKDLKFVIFGSGHDYTRLDSGEGNDGKRFFSHPFVPLNSTNGLSQYYFTVPDEYGEKFDAVRYDSAHCTFDPAIGSTFDTEGDVEVKVTYYREYIDGDETIVVSKELKQTITVVDHGTIAYQGSMFTRYSDGYCFWKGDTDSNLYNNGAYYSGRGSKSSSLPWRARDIHNLFMGNGATLTDISELEYADTSNVNDMDRAFLGSKGLTDISALASWDVSNVTDMSEMFMETHITTVEALENWDVSSLKDIHEMFRDSYLTSAQGLHNWNPPLETVYGAFMGTKLKNCLGLENFDMSGVSYAGDMFLGSMTKGLESLDGLESWDVSNIVSFDKMFAGNVWLSDISAIRNWDFSSADSLESMFQDVSWVSDVSMLNWDLSNASNLRYLLYGFAPCHSIPLDKEVTFMYGYYYDKAGNLYTHDEATPIIQHGKDATGSENWNVQGQHEGFDAYWSHTPDWNI